MGLLPGSDKKAEGPAGEWEPTEAEKTAQKGVDLKAKHLSGIGAQVDTLKKGVDLWDQQSAAMSAKEDADKIAARQRAAGALATMQFRTVGATGAGMAGMRAAAAKQNIEDDVRSADYQVRLADLAARRQQASETAVQGQTAYDEAQLQSLQSDQADVTTATSDVDAIFGDKQSNVVVYTDADARAAASEARRNVRDRYPTGSAAWQAAEAQIQSWLDAEVG